jgi:anti-anti-sigma factor
VEPEQGAVLGLQGELDDEACAALRRQLAPRLGEGARHVLLDLAHVSALTPSAVGMLRALSEHLRRRAGGLLLVHAQPSVRRSLRVNDLEHLLQVRDLDPLAPAPPALKPRIPASTDGVIPIRRHVQVAQK